MRELWPPTKKSHDGQFQQKELEKEPKRARHQHEQREAVLEVQQKGHNTKKCRTEKDKLYCKFCRAKGHVSEACKKEKTRNNGMSRPNNTHKARQVTGAETPEDTRLTTTKSVEPATATRSTA